MDIRYFAGLFDGEGSIGIYRTGYPINGRKDGQRQWGLKITIVMTTPQPLKQIKAQWGGYAGIEKRNKRKNSRDVFLWYLHGEQASGMLKELLPYLMIKRDEALIAIEFQATKRGRHDRRTKIDQTTLDKRQELANELKRLKRLDYTL